MTMTSTAARFPSPFEAQTPPGAEGWERMYPNYLLFSDDNREWEESMLWFQDGIHHPEVEMPFDALTHEAYGPALGCNVGRTFAVPPAYGIANRIVNGYVYTATTGPTDPEWIGQRAELFLQRAGFYYQNWDDLFERWKTKVRAHIADLRDIEIPRLPRVEEESVVTEALGYSKGYSLLEGYDRIINNVFLVYQYHFEMLVLGYAAYLNLFTFCKGVFPGLTDDIVAQMAAGTDILFFRPDDELKGLAALALDLGLGDRLRQDKAPEAIVADLRDDPAGMKWIEAFDAAQDPWFYFSNGNGLSHHYRSWIDDLTFPWAAMLDYLGRLERGEDLDRPKQEILERRDRVTAEYRELLGSDEDRTAFDQNVGLARTVAAYIEDHNFHIEHWHHTILWNKVREVGDRLVEAGMLEDREDVFYLNRLEVGEALYEAVVSWSTGTPTRGQRFWPREVAERKRIFEALRAAPRQPAFGPVPEEVTDAFAIMLWGLSKERLQQWLGEDGEASNELTGMAGSPGLVEGRARVLADASQLSDLEEGEILVCPVTAPSWGPVFGRIKAAVCDIGGIMSHAAIVCREYGLPAVVGVGSGTVRIRTGNLLRVDGNTGKVTILE
jgi:pyruvate,water dikinase